MPVAFVTTTHDLREGDTICEKDARGKTHFTKVKKCEYRTCGVHINDSICYNAPVDLVVMR